MGVNSIKSFRKSSFSWSSDPLVKCGGTPTFTLQDMTERQNRLTINVAIRAQTIFGLYCDDPAHHRFPGTNLLKYWRSLARVEHEALRASHRCHSLTTGAKVSPTNSRKKPSGPGERKKPDITSISLARMWVTPHAMQMSCLKAVAKNASLQSLQEICVLRECPTVRPKFLYLRSERGYT